MSTMPPSRVEVRRDLLVLGSAAAILFFLSLGARDLWNPNEPIYGQGVQEMDARNDWLVPTVNGLVFAEKPILYYWIALAASRVSGGVSELSLRIPSAMAGLGGAFMLYLLVYPYAGRSRSRLAVALYTTTFMVYWGSRTAQMDILVMATSLGALLAMSRLLDHGLSPRAGWSLAGLAAGLGFLAKGPVGVLCPGIPALLYILVTGRLSVLRTRTFALGAFVLVATAAPWLILLWARGEADFIVELLFRQNITRFLDPWDHHAPWWYYLGYFWIDMAPWAFFIPLAAKLPDRDSEERKLDLMAWLWIVSVVLFFSLSQSKRSAYILPIAPAVAILASGVAERLLEGRLERARTRLSLILLAFFGASTFVTGLVLWWRVLPRYPEVMVQGRALVMLLVLGGAAILTGFLARRSVRSVVPTAFFSLLLVLYLLVSVSLLPALNVYKSARPFCQRVAALVAGEAELASFGFWDWRASYTFYLSRPVRNLGSLDELREYWEEERQVFLLLENLQLDKARGVLGDSRPWVRSRVGGKTVYLFSNRQEPSALEEVGLPEQGQGDGQQSRDHPVLPVPEHPVR